MSTGLIDIMKRAAIDANESNKPADLRFGTVTSVNPLKIQVTNQFILPKSVLIIPEHLTDYEIEVTVKDSYGWDTKYKSGGSGDPAFASHNHDIAFSRKKILVHGALKVGDKVALMRKQGGQFYYILDRLPKGD